MAIRILTGQPRNGKSLRAVKEIYKLVKENDELEKKGKPRRKIYVDIAGINGPDVDVKFDDCVTDLTREQKETIWFGKHDDPAKPDHLWCPPYNSIFMFDECHKLDFIKDVSGSLSKNPSTISLNEHGHAGHIIYLITQFPNYIHTHIRGLTQDHWHVKKKFNLPMAKVYKWDDFILNPRAEVNLKNANGTEWFFFRDKYKKAYISAAAHEKQPLQFPPVLILPIVALLIIGMFLFNRKDDSIILNNDTAGQVDAEQVEQIQAQNQQQLEQINQMRIELEELKAKYLPKHIATLAAYEDVRPAMVISNSNGGCIAYNTYGEPLLLTDSLCYQMSEQPALIPKSRQSISASNTLPESSFSSDSVSNPFDSPTQSQSNVEVVDFKSPRPYS